MADELNMDQLKEDCKRQNAMFSASIVMHLIARIETARAAALNEAAAAVEQHDKTGREWVPGSLWDTISREGAARIRALERRVDQNDVAYMNGWSDCKRAAIAKGIENV